ncbi:uncharacterized protein LOC127714772 [Mytilus californianus]|uniref:uncharacterized protein LOC127714772 n=1 Tax=Mytilus californianus TaxID=6549 RepID=UPI002248288E|nr:uncharacterized protein LOC127714772 [Mytilus californianus]
MASQRLKQKTVNHAGGKPVYDSNVATRLEEEKRESKRKDKKIDELEKELSVMKKLLKQEKAEREKINHGHEKMISDLKHAHGKNLDKTLRDENDRLKHEIDKITIEKEDLGKEVDRLRTSLSKVAGDRMMDGNPFVTDLSDPNRPQRLAEKFNCLYDNSWTDAFEILLAKKKDEKSICKVLLDISEACWIYCSGLSKHQFSSLQKACMEAQLPVTLSTEMKEDSSAYTKHLTDARRSCARTFIPLLCQHFWEKEMNKDHKKEETLKPYVDACLELFWYSAITDPPLYYSFIADNLDDFRGYTKNGDEMDFIVWPAMYLHENGPLLYQGVVQYK